MNIVATLFLVGVAAALSFALGTYLQRRLRIEEAARSTELAQAERDRVLAQAALDAERLREQSAREVELHRARIREEIEAELSEERRALRAEKQRIQERQLKNQQRFQRLQEREALIHQGMEAIGVLRREIEQQQQRSSRLVQQAQSNHSETQRHKADAERLQQDIALRQRQLESRNEDLTRKERTVQELHDEAVRRLENLSGLSAHDARELLKQQLIEEARLEAAGLVKEVRDEARLRASREARHVILTAIQRTAASQTIENTVSVVNIQSDEMKGRIIGREGRNIRSFESATGIEVIVDDTPEAVILSGFDPVRREVARIALSKLIQDGRIHPTRIEEVVEKVRQDMEEELVETGERTVIELNLHGIHPDIIRMIGRMKYRSSYGQNLLAHSIETARLASLMAAELGLDTVLAKRAGLLHDIGKVMEDQIDQPHAIVGMEFLRKYKEHPDVLNAVGAHHDEIEMTCMNAPIVQAADAISGARPGARRESLDSYIKRLEKLEALASSFKGVERVFAIQAGREIRVLVNHELISDALADQLARDISQKIESELQYPGQVRVTVIREVRATAYAR